MGVYHKGGILSYRKISDNISIVANYFKYNNGYFGAEGKGRRVRVIYSDDPVISGKEFYSKISYGGIEKDLPNGKGKITYMADGSIVTYRPKTKSDDYPGVEINISKSVNTGGVKQQKIHFGKKG